MKKALCVLLLCSSSAVSAAQLVGNKQLGLDERVLMRGSDYVEMCSLIVDSLKASKPPRVDGCLLYTEGLRSGYSKATTEVITQAALFNASPAGDNWNAALTSPFYDQLGKVMKRCDQGVSTAQMASELSNYVTQHSKETDVMSSNFYNFLKDNYKGCK